ncbi:GspE/PulE family protein [Roseateles puraquae]|uniref:General secretion pathway protein GspE n=1 Tax=Roseateles puraquae TaxID=431059 RepID=A0A254N8V0_9BURK|nr:GspE/PulE family protein [Roseateles puraquae]MDG0854995.1 type II/IV secretion system protein [Roseateles puraquae]OWR04436.1 general secretion pathway protein GspE [Roseateles puraquae]
MSAVSLTDWLPADQGPWHLDFEQWPQAQAQRWRAVLAVGEQGRRVLLAERDEDALLLQSIEARLNAPVGWQRCSGEAVTHFLGAGEADFRALSDVEEALAAVEDHTEELSALALSEQASPVVRLLNATLYDALQDAASDIHIECTARGAVIRFRVDGVMAVVRQVEGPQVAEQLVSRLKVMAELDIGERRLPQDGRFKLRVQGREIDFRLSIMPSVFGEDAVIRILDRAAIARAGTLTLDALGFGDDERAAIRHQARQPHGMLLVTGPTGSGKTTTLYATLAEIHTGADKIITIEDPVEYQLAGVVQIPVNEKKGLTFSRGLRSILRHDPDRVMVGEIRDAETAQIAVQAALTGHLVFSTVHANNAFDVIGRFMHMGLDLYNVVSALNAVLAQRLLRLTCKHCAQPFMPDAATLARHGVLNGNFLKGEGCGHCRGTGYKGRRAVAELLRLDDGLRDLIAARAPMSEIKAAARARGMKSLREMALAAVCRGETTFEELERVTLDE